MNLGRIGLAVIPMTAAILSSGSTWPPMRDSTAADIDRLGARMAAEAIRAGKGAGCGSNGRCDRLTGCIAPEQPAGPIAEALPDGAEYRLYIRNLRAFQLCRHLVQLPESQDATGVNFANAAAVTPDMLAFAEIAERWNGEFLWEPASKSGNVVTRSGDEARAVFGPIPDVDCSGDTAKTIPLEIEGNIVDLKANPGKPGQPLEFEHRNVDGHIVKWTTGVAQCDKPSLAGNVAYCGMNSRLNRVVNGSVEWLFFCRKSTTHLEVNPDPYWLKSNPKFARLGIIGFNRQSGEIAFFDGRKDRAEFDWSQGFVQPGGRSYADMNGRAEAEALYDPTFQIPCSACHDNKNAYVVNPHIAQARVGYGAGAKGREASAFSLGDYLPETPRTENMPFRVVGSGYTATHRIDLDQARTVRDPTGNCTECHTLTTQVTGQRFAPDAVARKPSILNPTWSQRLRLRAERLKLIKVNAHRTSWAFRSGAGKIHPWMLPATGNDVSHEGSEISAGDWGKLSNCLWGAGGAECGYRPLYTACPAPGLLPQEDGSAPENATIAALPRPPGEFGADRLLRISWDYLNRYGNVPQRDDVRFNVAIKSVPVPVSGQAPSERDYPGADEAKGRRFTPITGDIGISDTAMLIRNVSYFGHAKFTEPEPSTGPRAFRLDVPAKCNRRYLARILPKRMCFDQSNIAYADKGQLLYADIRCN